jgi:hypothetical protein
MGCEVEELGDLVHARLDLGARQAAILEREGEILAHRHGVVDHRELEHLGDVALLGRERADVLAVKQDLAA